MTNPLFGLRTAVILLAATAVGVGAAALTRAAGDSWPRAVLAGFATTGAATVLFNGIISRLPADDDA
jgi:drug/metabolite transporter (DMT)-like permease